jgi:hypothetical protein
MTITEESMSNATIERTIYDNDSDATSQEYAVMVRRITLPPAPYKGMMISVGFQKMEVGVIEWQPDDQWFRCRTCPEFSENNLTETIDVLKRDGWRLSGRYKNDNFIPQDEALTEDEKLRQELAQLSEATRLEFHRKLENALYLKALAAQEKLALETANERAKEVDRSVKESQKTRKIWAVSGLVILVGFLLFSDNVQSITPLIFIFISVDYIRKTLLDFLHNQVICPNVRFEVQRKQDACELTKRQWQLLTGTSKYLAEENEPYKEDFDDEQYIKIKRQILIQLKNRDYFV